MTIPLLPPHSRGANVSSTRLVAVLTHLGHHCLGACGSASDELDARAWFSWRRAVDDGRPSSALIVVDIRGHLGPAMRSIQLLRQVNACTTPDGIHVSQRRSGDAGHALETAQRSRRELT